MKKKDNIRSSFVKESLDKYTKLAASINENTESAVRTMLDEAVRNAYANILKEEDEDYDVDEVEDTEDDTAEVETGAADGADDGMEPEDDAEEVDVTDDVETDDDETEGETEISDEETDGDDEEGWSDFSKYEVSDDKYDLSQAEDDEIVKVYKLLKNDDNVIVNKNNGNVEIKDNETGAEYIISMGDDETVADQDDTEEVIDDDTTEFEVDDNDDFDNEEQEDMNESKIFELVLNEYKSNVGYTDNYQKKDVMTNPGMKEPGKDVNDWDAGVPKGTEKPFSGKKDDKKTNQPFDDEKGKQIEEEEVVDNASDETPIEEAGLHRGGRVQQNSTAKSYDTNSPSARKSRNGSEAGEKKRGTADAPYSNVQVESIVKKANKIFKENNELKAALTEFKTVLEEAVVTNVNLGNIIKLLSENSTSNDEKKTIIERFGDNVKTVNESNSLYKMISSELKNREKIAITESKDYSAKPNTQINETKIYQSADMLKSLELMNKICKR